MVVRLRTKVGKKNSLSCTNSVATEVTYNIPLFPHVHGVLGDVDLRKGPSISIVLQGARNPPLPPAIGRRFPFHHWLCQLWYVCVKSGMSRLGIQWQLNRRYFSTYTPGHVAAQFNWHGNCTTVTVDTVVLGKFQAACISKITVERTTFLPCILTNKWNLTEGVAAVLWLVTSNAAILWLVSIDVTHTLSMTAQLKQMMAPNKKCL